MLVAQSRPRNLSWLHAGPLLFGDWGTSRLYVLGLAFYYTAHASLLYLVVMALIMAGVAWAYTIVCRCFPDGGGVYTAARQLNPTLAVIGATLLLCDFIVTAALSAVDGFHYLGVPRPWVVPAVLVTLGFLGAVNWLGARNAGRLALLIALISIAASAIIGVLCVPFIGKGLHTAVATVPGVDKPAMQWESLVRIVLALSGVEAVANMTGLMKQPVAKTAKKTIWPVLAEVVILNIVFSLALNAIQSPVHAARVPDLVTAAAGAAQVEATPSPPRTPDYVHYELHNKVDPDNVPEPVQEYRDTAVKLLATHTATNALGPSGGRFFGIGAGIVFGLLLLSAVNTAVMAMVSVMYSLARDQELPRALTKLNYSGVPWFGLIVSCLLPAAVLMITSDVKALGELYAIGVVGAIAINLLSCAWNKELVIKHWERTGLWILGGLMVAVELTIIVAKPHATIFAGVVLAAVLGSRFIVHQFKPPVELVHIPQEGWLAELRQAPLKVPTDKPRLMLAARGLENSQFAVDRARRRGAVLFGIYVRSLRVLDVRPGQVPKIEDDPQSQEVLGFTAQLARQAGVPFFPIYVASPDIVEEILDYTVTFGCDELIMGRTRRGLLARTIEGDVVTRISRHLPEGVSMIQRAGGPVKAVPRQPQAEHEENGEEPPPS